MKKILFILAIAVIASGCTSTDNPENTSNPGASDTSTPTDLSSSNNTIFFTDSGFEPENLEIEAGETVTWVDNSDQSMWVASDVHPSHREYSGTSLQQHCQNGDQSSAAFDQCGTGDKFSFTFEKTGEWSYHNHQPFVQGGTVTVN